MLIEQSSLLVHMQVEISLQPWHAFKPDGVILFSDILTPLAGMNIDFDIVQNKGPVIADPIRSMEVHPPPPPPLRGYCTTPALDTSDRQRWRSAMETLAPCCQASDLVAKSGSIAVVCSK